MGQRGRVIHGYSLWAEQQGLGPYTRKRYAARVTSAENWLRANRDRSVVWASAKDLQAWMFQQGKSPRNRNNCRAALVSFFDYLVSEEILPANVAKGIPRLPEPRSLPKAHSAQTTARVLAVSRKFPLEVEALIHIFLFAGLRKTEARTLEWRHIDLESGWLQFKGKGKGGGKERSVPIHPVLHSVLRRWRMESMSAKWVFPSPRYPNRAISDSGVKEWLYAVGNEVGLVRFNPHSCRHSAATMLLEAGADIRDVQEFLGHATIATTQIYTRIRPSRLRDAVLRMDPSALAQQEEQA